MTPTRSDSAPASPLAVAPEASGVRLPDGIDGLPPVTLLGTRQFRVDPGSTPSGLT